MQALILINDRGTVDPARQLEACSAYVDTAPYLDLAGVVRHGHDGAAAADAIRAGTAEVVVAAYRDPKLELTQAIEKAGGRVEYVQPAEPGRLTVRSIVASMYHRLGWSAATIARAIGASTADVVDHLRRAGIRP